MSEDERFECPICLEHFREPKILPCFHTICRGCLETFVTQHASYGRFRCPLCKTIVKLPPGGVKDFQHNFYVQGSKQERPRPSVGCDVCDERAAVHCMPCNQNFCPSCKVVHGKVSATKDHDLTDVPVASSSSSTSVKQTSSRASPAEESGSKFSSEQGVRETGREAFQCCVVSLVAVVMNTCSDKRKVWALERLNDVCRYTSQDNKERAGTDLELIPDLLTFLRDRLGENPVCDEVVHRVWSNFWTLTDEVPTNSKCFVVHSGLSVLKICTQLFGDDTDLAGKLIGTMANLAEIKVIRPLLMDDDLLKLLRRLMTDEDKDVQTRYGSLFTLVHIVADGPHAWQLEEPSRDTVIEEIEKTLDSWDDSTDLGIAFRFLTPMLQKLDCYETPVAQHWALWTINNLVSYNMERYGDMLWVEGGQEMMTIVSKNSMTTPKIQKLIDEINTKMS